MTPDWQDRYQEALASLVKAKLAGVTPPVIDERTPAPVVNLMDAIRQSLEALPGEVMPTPKGPRKRTDSREGPSSGERRPNHRG